MSDTPSSRPPHLEFLGRVQRLIKPLHAECFSKETKSTKNLLLVTSFVLFLVVLGAITVEHRASFKVPMLGLNVTLTAGLRWILVALCAYFALLLAARAHAEWNVWRLVRQAPLVELGDLNKEIAATFVQIDQKMGLKLARVSELQERLTELGKDTPEIQQLATRLSEVMQGHEKLADEMRRQREQSGPEFDAVQGRWLNVFHKWQDLSDELERQRSARKINIGPTQNTLRTEIQKTTEEYQKEVDAPEREQLAARAKYLLTMFMPTRRTYQTRFWIELVFPLMFGALAILWGALMSMTEAPPEPPRIPSAALITRCS